MFNKASPVKNKVSTGTLSHIKAMIYLILYFGFFTTIIRCVDGQPKIADCMIADIIISNLIWMGWPKFYSWNGLIKNF